MLTDWLGLNIHMAVLAFARIGTALIVMPGFGEMRIPARARIAIAVLVTLCLLPALPMPAIPVAAAPFAALCALEALVGVFLGMGVRLFVISLHLLGGIAGFATGLSNAFAPPDANFEGANTLAALLHVAMIALIFLTNTHHLMLTAVLRSYGLIPVGQLILGDLVSQMARLGAAAFYLAAMVGAPLIAFAILLNLALGLANRVMPTMQVFFVAGPAITLAGLAILALAASSILHIVLMDLSDWLLALRR
ncbi:flagellar biosynthetic protein FliR [Paracoccus ravus]|uniref:flagellar biosynthetic protein FliR n=1 Tax=Paracoccus ravus TaxID=2447760 RepID=UPI00106E2813|nr:flagellar biosynthetic protein FliR [Paracoccus ravus]